MYTALTVVAMAAAAGVDVFVLRTRLLATRAFWISLVIMVFFQIFVDGWLTRTRDTIVSYDPEEISGVRVFFNSPIEDFGFGFALIVLSLSVWTRLSWRSGEDR